MKIVRSLTRSFIRSFTNASHLVWRWFYLAYIYKCQNHNGKRERERERVYICRMHAGKRSQDKSSKVREQRICSVNEINDTLINKQ